MLRLKQKISIDWPDFAMRLPLIALMTWLSVGKAVALKVHLQQSQMTWSTHFIAETAAHLASLLFLILIVVMVAIRLKPLDRVEGWQASAVALLGSFLLVSFVLFPRLAVGDELKLLSAALIFLGNGLAIFALATLGRSFSLLAEARRLVTDGPYRLVRHPLYLAEELAAIGIYIQHASPWTTLLLFVHWLCQLRRMENEERVLGRQFPEYRAYRERTARLIPRVY